MHTRQELEAFLASARNENPTNQAERDFIGAMIEEYEREISSMIQEENAKKSA